MVVPTALARAGRLSLGLVLVAVSLFPPLVFGQGATTPELPRVWLDTSLTAPSGRTIAVAAGGDFQAALDAAQPGDTITLQAGATFTGNYTLPNKSGTGWIIVRTSAPDASLPPPGTRITPAYATVLPKVVSPISAPAIAAAAGAHHYRLIGLEVTIATGLTSHTAVGGLVQLGEWQTQTTLAQVPHDIILDRLYVHGRSTVPLRRCIALNSASTAIIDSYIAEAHHQLYDAQAIGSWNGPGPFKIVNNHLEGSGENLMFGGADPGIPNLVPSDIEIRHNRFFKPLTWRVGDPSYGGIHWAVKNLLEFKNAQRVLVDGNVLEHSWYDAQDGFGVIFTPRNQDGQSPWSVVQDVTFTNNVLRHSGSAVNFLGTDNNHPSQRTKRILIANNLFEDIDGAKWGGIGRLFQLYDGTVDVVIDHNTGLQTGEIIGDTTYATVPGAPHTGFVFRNNIAPHNQYGVVGLGTKGDPLLTLTTYFPGAIFARNVLAGGDPSNYPPDNFFPSSLGEVGFVDLAGADYHLADSSAYRNAGTDGADLGATDALDSATAGVVGGAIPDALPPTVSILSPADGAALAGAVTLVAAASDNASVASVRFTLDGADLGPELTAAPYAVVWDTTRATQGPHTLRAVARDAAGNPAAAAVTITVASADTQPPAISGVAASSITSAGATITWITDEASDSVVEYGPTTAYGSASSSTAMVTSHARTLTGLVPGTPYHYRVRSTDAATNAAVSGDFTFTTNTSPAVSVSITTPSAGATVSGKIKVSAAASAGAGIAGVQFMLDGANLGGRDTSTPYSIRWTTNHTSNGPHTLTAVATDRAGNTATSSVTVTVKNGP